MGYEKRIYEAPNHIEYEFLYTGEYGSKGEKKKKEKPTELKIKQYNQWQQEKRVRRLLQLNFFEDDYWVCLQYRQHTKKDIEEVKKDVRRFIRRLKTLYRRQGKELKFIYRIEIGKQGGVHVHFISNRVSDTDLLLKDAWKRASNETGVIDLRMAYEEGGFEKLAAYITKDATEEIQGQLKFNIADEQAKKVFTVSTSRNLIRPEPEKRKYKHWTMRKLLTDGPKPSEGFHIETDSIEIRVNPYTGYTHYCYRESRIKPITRKEYENDLLSKDSCSHQHKNSHKA